MKEPFDHTAVCSFLIEMLTKNVDWRSKDRANSSQNRRDRDSQNMQDVMVFESADNDSWRIAGLPPKHHLSSKKSNWGSLLYTDVL